MEFFFFLPAFNPNNWHENLYSKQERQILRDPHRSTKGKKRKQKLGWHIRNNKPWAGSPRGQQHTTGRHCSSPECGLSIKNHKQHTSVPKFTWTRTEQERGRRTQVERGQNPGETEWRRGRGRQHATSHAGTLVRTSGHWATLGENRGPEKVRHTSITETNRLPSALVVVPSLCKLKNKGRDNREQLVTFKKLKKQNVISY